MSFQGSEFTPEMRKMIVNVKHFFDDIKKKQDAMDIPASKLAASALDISESTVKKIMAVFNKKGEDGLSFSKFQQRGHPAYTIGSDSVPLVRQFIREANRNGDQVNIKIILSAPPKTAPTHPKKMDPPKGKIKIKSSQKDFPFC